MLNPEMIIEWIRSLPTGWRLLAIAGVALAAHALVRGLRLLGEWILSPAESPKAAGTLIARRAPKVATVAGLVVSALTFVIYFLAVGFVIRELTPLTLSQYLASATVIGLAVGFGTQGLVQDIVTGLTLIFSNAVDVGDLVEIAGQTGRVDRIGLRFTVLTTFDGKTVYMPNRNIATIGRYRVGFARLFVDVQLPDAVEPREVASSIERLSHAFRRQHAAVIVGEPRVHSLQHAGDDGWPFLRVRFRVWPGQQALLEGPLRQRVVARMRQLDPDYADWMVTVTHRVQAPPSPAQALESPQSTRSRRKSS